MKIEIVKTNLEEIRHFRVSFLEENDFQFVCDKCHLYGWADTYLFLVNNEKVGYGALWGEKRDIIFEFYTVPSFRELAAAIFRQFISVSRALFIECQTNDRLLSPMLFEYAYNIGTEAILFEDHIQTDLRVAGVILTRRPLENASSADVGGYVLEKDGEPVATGGFMLNYNFPYADIYMEVNEDFRRQGFGSYIIQELKKEVYAMGRVPAARCNVNNIASKSTLLKAGFRVCGYRVKGDVKETLLVDR